MRQAVAMRSGSSGVSACAGSAGRNARAASRAATKRTDIADSVRRPDLDTITRTHRPGCWFHAGIGATLARTGEAKPGSRCCRAETLLQAPHVATGQIAGQPGADRSAPVGASGSGRASARAGGVHGPDGPDGTDGADGHRRQKADSGRSITSRSVSSALTRSARTDGIVLRTNHWAAATLPA